MQTKSKFIYIVLSRTETGIAHMLRRVGSLEYNHAAVALDKELRELYAFARTEQYGYLLARLVRETTDRYLVHAENGIPILVYQIPVTDEQFCRIYTTIQEIFEDPDYLYNLFSVLTNPLIGGFRTYKAYSCSEFVAFLLQKLGYETGRPLPSVRPDHLRPLLKPYLIFDGNLLDYVPEQARTVSTDYFRPVSPALVYGTVLAAAVLLCRSLPLLKMIRRKKH